MFSGFFLILVFLVWGLITTALFPPTSGDVSGGRRSSPVARFQRVGWVFPLGFLFVLVFMVLVEPFGFWTAPIRARWDRARADLKTLASEITASSQEGQPFPIPVDAEGNPVSPTGPTGFPAKPVEYSTAEVALYYVGPSFMPADVFPRKDFKDPFHDKGQEPYGYGAGVFSASRRALILTSRGPDKESQAETLESLFLDKHAGSERTFLRDLETSPMIYSPTNGIRSCGDLYHTGSF
jgi:hypothetical protein